MLKAFAPFATLLALTTAPVWAAGESASPPPEKDQGPVFAFVCLRDAKLPERAQMEEKLAAWFGLVSKDEVKGYTEATKGDSAVVRFEIGGKSFTISVANVPIPKQDIDYACENALTWPEATAELAAQKAHLIVMAHGKYDRPVDNALALSRAVAAASECFDSVAVYWGHAAVVHAPKAFRQEIWAADVKADGIPVSMWVGFLIAKGTTGGLDLFTAGLDVFGVREIEIVDSKRKTDEIFTLVHDLSAYLITKGDVIKDGDTVGASEGEKVASEYADSAIGRPGKVLRVRY